MSSNKYVSREVSIRGEHGTKVVFTHFRNSIGLRSFNSLGNPGVSSFMSVAGVRRLVNELNAWIAEQEGK